MKVIDFLEKANKPLISFEIIPPLRGGDIQQIFRIVEELMKFNPPFIDVTSHSAEVQYEETPTGIRKKIKRKRPGTIGLCVAIKNKFNVETVPHLLCRGFTREETEDALIELNYLGIENVLAIRGDEKGYKKVIPIGKTSNEYAVDLVEQIANMNKGIYLEEDLLDAAATNFCIGVGGYPEKHYEAPNLKTDIYYLKQKVNAGADYIVTQMFFDNKHFFKFKKMCEEVGIRVPIIPGLKIITSKDHLTSLPRDFFIDIPEELSGEILEADPKHTIEIGVNWAAKQVEELISNGVPGVHFYILQNVRPINMLFKKLKL